MSLTLSPRRRHLEREAEIARQVARDQAADRLLQQARRQGYRDGLRDGVILTLDELEGTQEAPSPEGVYRGPFPDELYSWIRQARRNYRRLGRNWAGR